MKINYDNRNKQFIEKLQEKYYIFVLAKLWSENIKIACPLFKV